MLRGERVVLRPKERADLKRLHELEQDVELVTLGDGDWKPESLASVERRYDERQNDIWRENASFVIEVDGQMIGDINLHGLNRRHCTAELGIGIYDRNCIGKGLGRDAIRTLLRWAFENQNWRRIWLEVQATNERALRSYRACGFVEEARLRKAEFHRGEYVDMILMGMLRSEWEAQERSGS